MANPVTLAVSSALVLAMGAHAQIAARWNFNSVPPDANPMSGTLAPDAGVGTAVPVGGVASGIAPGSPADPADAAGDNSSFFSGTYPINNGGSGTRGLRFNADTSGVSSIAIDYSQRTSGNASAWWRLEFTLNGTDFFSAGLPSEAPGGPGEYRFPAAMSDNWQSFTWDLAPIPGASENPAFGFRVVAIFAPGTNNYINCSAGSASGYNPSGTMRLDMVTVSGVVPQSGACCAGAACQIGVSQAACIGEDRSYVLGPGCNATGEYRSPCCKANFNKSDGITVQDLFDYLAAWFPRDLKADTNGIVPGDGFVNVTVQDLFDYLRAWFAKGCE